MALMEGRKVRDCGVLEEVDLERRERGEQPWRNGEESLRVCRGGSWMGVAVRGIESGLSLAGDKLFPQDIEFRKRIGL